MVCLKDTLPILEEFVKEILFLFCSLVLQKTSLVSRYLSYMVLAGNLAPISSPKGSVVPTHLFYTNDILLFCNGTCTNIINVTDALTLYGNFSRQKVSWDKSFIYFGLGITPRR